MNTILKLSLYCSIERNLDVGKTCIFLFEGYGVGSLISIKFLNLWSKNSRDGLEYKVFWNWLWTLKWLGFKSMYDQKFANQRSKTTLLLQKSLWKMCQFDRNMMGSSQNLSDTKFLRRYLQLETVSSSMAQFVDKWQKKMCNSLLIFWEKQWFFSKIEHFSLFLGRLFIQNPIC